ncbi:O-antigen ligase family protein [Halomonas tibetensis]|uniref:O-antigen ligase family protein n=1 Tax=Halomonas tibetensis TaxID=2259590 RepID=A0ABV7B6L9_9GAMM
MKHALPERAWPCPERLWIAGTVLMAVYAGFQFLWPTIGQPAETLTAVLGLIALLRYGTGLRNTAPLWLLLAALVVQTLSWWLILRDVPDYAADNPRLDRLAKLFIFIAVAWWLGGSTRLTLTVWGLALGGFLLQALFGGGGWEEWQAGLQGQRIEYGIRNAQHGAMLFGVTLLGLVIFAGRFWQPGRWHLARRGLWCAMTLLALVGVLIGLTRAVWLGLLLAFAVAAFVVIYHRRRFARPVAGGLTPLRLGLMGLALACVLALAGWAFQGTLIQRIADEREVLVHMAERGLEDVPYTSIGIRINTWQAGVEWGLERPWVGWGSEARSLVIHETPWLPPFVKEHFGHLHNFLLEVWVAYGLFGVMLILGLAGWVGWATFVSWRGGVMPGDMALFALAFFIYWAVVNQFESYNSFWTGVFVHNLIVGGLVTHYWRWWKEQRA